MATCKDCIHNGICEVQLEPHYLLDRVQKLMRESNNVEHECLSFKDRSRFVELPCKVGDEFFLLCENSSVFKYTVSCIDIFLAVVSIKNVYITLRSDRHNLKTTKGRFIYELNKTIFYTREAAERALKERENND